MKRSNTKSVSTLLRSRDSCQEPVILYNLFTTVLLVHVYTCVCVYACVIPYAVYFFRISLVIRSEGFLQVSYFPD